MTNPRYIDANVLIELATHEGAYGYVDVRDIHNTPTADVVEVVRCKDCLNAKEIRPGRYSCFSFAGTNDGNWYCPDGKRKETKDG